jgi:hypothetical protein
VYRALRADAAEPLVEIDAGYEVVHEDGDPEGEGGVALIECFEVSEGDDEGFLAAWEEQRADFAAQRGYLGSRLHRASGSGYVALVRWSSPLMYARTGGTAPLYQRVATGDT